jgi:hypothetical protein
MDSTQIDPLRAELDSTPEIPFTGTPRDDHMTDYGTSGAYVAQDEGIVPVPRRRVFSSPVVTVLDDDEDDGGGHRPAPIDDDRPPSRSAPPAVGRGAGTAPGPGSKPTKTAFQKLRGSMPPFVRSELDQQHGEMVRMGVQDDDWLWTFVHSILTAVLPLEKLASNLEATAKRIVGDAVKELAQAAGHLNTDALSDRIVSSAVAGLETAIERDLGTPIRERAEQEAAAHRIRWIALGAACGGVLPIAALVIGFFLGHAADVGGYREEYLRATASLPHVAHFVQTDVGRQVAQFVDENPAATVRGLMTCSADLGLHSAVSTTGERVCAGSADARHGWRIK